MEKTAEEMANEVNQTLESLKTDLETVKNKKTATPEELEEAKQALENYKSEHAEELKDYVKTEKLDEVNGKLDKALADLEEAQTEITSMKENGVGSSEKSELAKMLIEKKEEISNTLKEKNSGEVNMTIKANVLTTAVANNTRSMREGRIGDLAYRKLSLKDVFQVLQLGTDQSGAITYTDWDEATAVRAAAMVAEGAVFPESTAAWEEFTVKLKKIGDTIPISEEFTYDETRMVGEVERFLGINVALEEDSQLYSGDGLGQNLEGVNTAAAAYVAANQGMQDANIGDLVLKVAEDIARGKKSKYSADFVMMNLKTINDIWTKKDANNNYLETPFMTITADGINIAGMRVVESNMVADNELLVGDSRYGVIYEGDSYTLTTGYVDQQFGSDLATLKARKRMLLLIRNSEKQGFRKVTDITAALATLQTP